MPRFRELSVEKFPWDKSGYTTLNAKKEVVGLINNLKTQSLDREGIFCKRDFPVNLAQTSQKFVISFNRGKITNLELVRLGSELVQVASDWVTDCKGIK